MAGAPGEINLKTLLAGMKPRLNPGEYVYCRRPSLEGLPLEALLGFFREEEGLTIILGRKTADDLGLPYDYVAAWVTLMVNSSLEAVGFTAVVAEALARENISCNVVAAYGHDHLFFRLADADRAMVLLQELSKKQ